MNRSVKRFLRLLCAAVLCVACGVGAVALGYAAEPMLPSWHVPSGQEEIDFPAVKDFADIDAKYQSSDPDVYNFQFFARRDGLFCYFVQYLDAVVDSESDPWLNTHVEMEIWQYDMGYGWDGTYVALFLDETMYVNNLTGLRTYYNDVTRSTEGEKTKIEYRCWLEFDNNEQNRDIPYAYIKQYQFLPLVTEAQVPHSVFVARDDRVLVTGDEESWGVHDSIDQKMPEDDA